MFYKFLGLNYMVTSGKGLTQCLAPTLQSQTITVRWLRFARLSSPAGSVLVEGSLFFSIFLGLYLQIIKSSNQWLKHGA